jgi:hypothetical protein
LFHAKFWHFSGYNNRNVSSFISAEKRPEECPEEGQAPGGNSSQQQNGRNLFRTNVLRALASSYGSLFHPFYSPGRKDAVETVRHQPLRRPSSVLGSRWVSVDFSMVYTGVIQKSQSYSEKVASPAHG